MAGELLRIPLSQIRENPEALRGVNKESEAYLGLVDSVRTRGVLNAINVRERTDESGQKYYELVDGLHRYCASQDANKADIPAQVVDLTQTEVWEAQIIANVHKVETRPVEYTKQLLRILAQNPAMTRAELATSLGKSAQWLNERLSLTKLDGGIGELVDASKISLSNAYALAKLPSEEQQQYVDLAQTCAPVEFAEKVAQRVKEIREAARQGRTAGPSEWRPIAHCRKMSELKGEFEGGCPALTNIIAAKKPATPQDTVKLVLEWVLKLDDESVRIQKAEYEARQKAMQDAKAKAKAERAAQAAKEAAEAAAKVQEEAAATA